MANISESNRGSESTKEEVSISSDRQTPISPIISFENADILYKIAPSMEEGNGYRISHLASLQPEPADSKNDRIAPQLPPSPIGTPQNVPSAIPGLNINASRYQTLQNESFDKRLKSLYGNSVVQTKWNGIVVNLACLYRVRLHYLQQKLISEALDFKYKKDFDYADFSSLDSYVAALKNLEYIKERALKGTENDPFIVTTDRSFERLAICDTLKVWTDQASEITGGETPFSKFDEYLHDLLPRIANHCTAWFGDLPPPQDSRNWHLFGGSRTQVNKKESFERFLERVVMAVIGGAFLIGPMLVMVLVPGKNTSLITASVCVFAFAIMVSWFLEKKFDVLSATAAYAAVLVVFVGTSTGNAQGGV